MYQALYRKYRSKTFEELVGQDHIINALKNQIKRNEISHAYLFSGTRGTGKTSAAKIFARAVNCLNSKDGNPCNECEACKAILNDRAMDVVEMDAASNNGVDDIRELKEKVIYPPTSLKYKVYIIDEVHMLSKGAFNALLKILEEPPKYLIFILATTEPEKIPQTILSRTQRFNFKRIKNDDIVKNLKKIVELENKSCDDKVYELIAKESDGAMRDALSLLDQCLSFVSGHLSYEKATEILAIASDDLIFRLSEGIRNSNLNLAMEVVNEVYSLGKDINILISDLIEHYRNLMIVKTVTDPEKIIYTSRILEYKQEASLISLEEIIGILKILNESINQIKYATDKRVLFEMTLVKLINLKDIDLDVRLKKLEDIVLNGNFTKISEKNINNKQIDKSIEVLKEVNKVEIEDIKIVPQDDLEAINTEYNDVKSKEIGLDINRIKGDWNDLLDGIKKRKISTALFISNCQDIEYNENGLAIKFNKDKEFDYKLANTDENIKILKDFFKNYYNLDFDVRIILENDFKKETSIKKIEELFGAENIEIRRK